MFCILTCQCANFGSVVGDRICSSMRVHRVTRVLVFVEGGGGAGVATKAEKYVSWYFQAYALDFLGGGRVGLLLVNFLAAMVISGPNPATF